MDFSVFVSISAKDTAIIHGNNSSKIKHRKSEKISKKRRISFGRLAATLGFLSAFLIFLPFLHFLLPYVMLGSFLSAIIGLFADEEKRHAKTVFWAWMALLVFFSVLFYFISRNFD
jgi:hypothetical protein